MFYVYVRKVTSFKRKKQNFWWEKLRHLLCSTIKYIDKSLSGKSDEIEVNFCKNLFFTHHSSSLILRKIRFRIAKGKLWPRQRLCFIASNMVFHTTKHGLSRYETLPLANLDFVNCTFTDKQSHNNLSVNTLRKTSKIALFSTGKLFVRSDGLNLGLKFE